MAEVTVHHGDSRDVLKGLADCSIDAVVCDPPYALVSIGKRFGKDGAAPAKSNGATGVYARASSGFMGQQWDTGETAFAVEFWAEVSRVLKPGAHVVAFSGTRTYHRMACAIEDAGFEIRDAVLDIIASDTAAALFFNSLNEEQQRAFVKLIDENTFGGMLGWTFGSGFPKSHNQSGEWEGWGSALKPAWEPICLARKPLIGTIAANLVEHGCGALNIDGCRVKTDENLNGGAYSGARRDHAGAWQSEDRSGGAGSGFRNGAGEYAQQTGRWPANIIHDGSEEVIAAFPAAPGQPRAVTGEERFHRTKNAYGDFGASRDGFEPRNDSGSAARFFYTAKADSEDRLGSKHPTVKPIDLMAWLCRLVTPPGGVILDPFAGTGTTGLAAMREGFDCILIEREAEYVADIHRRLAWARGQGRLTAQETARGEPKSVHDLPLFGGEAA